LAGCGQERRRRDQKEGTLSLSSIIVEDSVKKSPNLPLSIVENIYDNNLADPHIYGNIGAVTVIQIFFYRSSNCSAIFKKTYLPLQSLKYFKS
jgi:hypothetical protein